MAKETITFEEQYVSFPEALVNIVTAGFIQPSPRYKCEIVDEKGYKQEGYGGTKEEALQNARDSRKR